MCGPGERGREGREQERGGGVLIEYPQLAASHVSGADL